MSQFGTFTGVETWTRVDVRRVFEAFEAHLRMIVRRTGLNSEQWAVDSAYDATICAGYGYLNAAHVVLEDAHGRELRAKVFRVYEGTLYDDERPGGNASWYAPPGSCLRIVLDYTAAWHQLTAAQQALVESLLRCTWRPIQFDCSHPDLRETGSRWHVSNGYGLHAVDLAR